MAEETKTIEKLTVAAKAALLEAITNAAGTAYRGPEALESLARAYAAVATSGPLKGEVG
ncbi:hypothetical protein [Pseudarthrobacter sp. DSP2-3-2b1]|uniref:hypothetical protein n=1 Tax=Pseudarthrobacter sp. DSP2-3-2b1 TaxID=2804661 RepID=UPI003CFBAC1D